MENRISNLLFGVRLDSYNRGVNALAVGGIGYIKENFNHEKTVIVNIGSKGNITKSILLDNKIIPVTSISFPGKDYLKCCFRGILYRILKLKPKDELSRLIYQCDNAFNLNEGDSFSDLYGRFRFFSHFFVSLAVLAWKKKLIFLPQTIGPFDTVYGKFLSTFILKRLDKLFVRDIAADIFLDKRKIQREYKFDVACIMQLKPVVSDNFFDNFATVGININALMYFNSYGISEYSDKYQLAIKEIVDFCLSKSYKVLLIPHTYDVSARFFENDYEANNDFIKKYSYISNKNISCISKNYDAQEIKSIISNASVFIGSRMHACIAALSTNVPTIGIAYSYKFRGTFSNFGQEEFVIDIKKNSMIQIKNSLSNIITNKSSIEKQLEYINANRE